MNPAQAMAAMNARAEVLAAGGAPDPASLVRAAKAAAGKVRQLAASSGHSVSIRVIERPNGVRISVSGHQAHRYRAVVTAELDRLRPETKADLAAAITRKIR